MKKYARPVMAAEDAQNEKLTAAISGLKEDFDFLISGLEHLDRTGAEESNQALIIAERMGDALQSCIAEVSGTIGG